MTPSCIHSAWEKTSTKGSPVVGISTCAECGKTADDLECRLWRARKRLRDFNERKAGNL